VKYIKVDLLAQLANVNNMGDILDELCVYVSEVDVGMARRAIRAIGRVGFKLPGGFESGVSEKLVEFLDLDVDYVQAEAVLVLMDLLRKYPERRGPMLDRAQRCLREAEEPAARAALIWLVGEYGLEVTEAPYLLEAIVDGYDDEASAEVKLALLTASVKVFFQRPPEMHRALGRLLAAATNDIASQEVHDRALFYYRLLKANPNVARDVVLAGSDAVMKGQAGVPGSGSNVANGFAEDHEVLSKDVLFEEFNSLSVIYGKSERLFIAFDKCPRKPEPSTASAAAAHAATPMPPMPPGAASLSGDLLGDAAAPPPPAAAVAAMAHAPAVSLLPDF
jgi:AP-4 complex subunit beta-1